MSNPQTPFLHLPRSGFTGVCHSTQHGLLGFFNIANVQKQNYVQKYLQLNLGYSKIKWKPLIIPKHLVSGIM